MASVRLFYYNGNYHRLQNKSVCPALLLTCGFPSTTPQKKDSLMISFTSRGNGFWRFPIVMFNAIKDTLIPALFVFDDTIISTLVINLASLPTYKAFDLKHQCIAGISHNCYNWQWCTFFFKLLYFLAQRTRNVGLFWLILTNLGYFFFANLHTFLYFLQF